jgi:hypothetical protein
MREDNFERELEAALAKYAAAEPRAGLQQRVIASLRARRRRQRQGQLLLWPVIAAMAAVVAIAAVSMMHRSSNTTPDLTAIPAESQYRTVPERTHAAESEMRVTAGREHRVASEGSVKRAEPRVRFAESTAVELNQFPSPEPLSEQEKLLLRYVRDDPENAELLAEAVTLVQQWKSDQPSDLASGKPDSEKSQR